MEVKALQSLGSALFLVSMKGGYTSVYSNDPLILVFVNNKYY